VSRYTQRLSKPLRPFLKDHFLLAVSGGMDSVALLGLFLELRRIFEIQITVTHIHHGHSENIDVLTYRNQALREVKNLCKRFDVSFLTNDDRPHLPGNEASLRDFRYNHLRSFRKVCGAQWIVLAHHEQDQLETRLIQMIRGTGSAGVQGMTFIQETLLRPLLDWSRSDLFTFCKEQDLSWLEDPSNAMGEDLRSWLRTLWLPQLEEKRSGSLASLHRSLENIASFCADQLSSFSLPSYMDSKGSLEVTKFLQLSLDQKSQILAQFMAYHGFKNFSRGHIKEVLKRLDSCSKRLKFSLLGRQWSLDAQLLGVERPSEIETSD